MTPREKAEELIEKFMDTKSLKLSDYSKIEYPTAKICALIVVNELYVALKNTLAPAHGVKPGQDYKYNNQYWEQVKEEINNL
jgi:hypothetical protein